MPRELSRLRTFLPVNFRAREPNPNPNPNPGTGELSHPGAKVPLARKFRLPHGQVQISHSIDPNPSPSYRMSLVCRDVNRGLWQIHDLSPQLRNLRSVGHGETGFRLQSSVFTMSI